MVKKFKHDFTLGNRFFEYGKLTKYSDPDKYGYNGYGRVLARSEFSLLSVGVCKNVFIFGADSCSPRHIDTGRKDILIICECPTQGLDGTTI